MNLNRTDIATTCTPSNWQIKNGNDVGDTSSTSSTNADYYYKYKHIITSSPRRKPSNHSNNQTNITKNTIFKTQMLVSSTACVRNSSSTTESISNNNKVPNKNHFHFSFVTTPKKTIIGFSVICLILELLVIQLILPVYLSSNINDKRSNTAGTLTEQHESQKVSYDDSFVTRNQRNIFHILDTTPTPPETVGSATTTTTSSGGDEYYIRNHTDYSKFGRYDYALHRRIYDANMNAFQQQPPILIVGGLDGSGTRVFAEMLLNVFGVQMLYDDNISYDLHGTTLCSGLGWPALAKLILNTTKSAKYEPHLDLPSSIYNESIREIQTLKRSTDEIASYLRLEHVEKWKSIDLTSRTGEPTYALGTNYGFKAPISMVLLPLLHVVYGNIKFLHIIRDGRDVAFSTNTSPVEKYYDVYKGIENATRIRETAKNLTIGSSSPSNNDSKSGVTTIDENCILQMELWNDWNVQVYEYAKEHWHEDLFDYITVRAEDILPSTNEDVRLHTLQKIGHFVGTQRTDDEIQQYNYGISKHSIKDMGKSIHHEDVDFVNYNNNNDKTNTQMEDGVHSNNTSLSSLSVATTFQQSDPSTQDAENIVTNRYGKWKQKVQAYPVLFEKLHEIGSDGLHLFGYV